MGEEISLAAMRDFLGFRRGQGESIDELLSRFETTRQRAQVQAG